MSSREDTATNLISRYNTLTERKQQSLSLSLSLSAIAQLEQP